MTATAPSGDRVLGSLRVADGRGVVHIENRYDAAVEEVWSAITEPKHLANWHAQVSGDLRVGGDFRLYLESDGWEGTGHVVACEPPRRLLVTTRESDESWQKGQGAPPFDEVIEVMLTADGEATSLVIEIAGLPLDVVAFYGAGWQIHTENLGDYLAGRPGADSEARWDQLVPPYQALAAKLT